MPTSEDKEITEMNKEKYEPTEIEVIKFKTDDVIQVSDVDPNDEYEGEKAMI